MKTLVIQLARFGDIYQSWPSLIALSENPNQEVHLLVRERFIGATKGLPRTVNIHSLDSKMILEPLFNNEENVDVSLQHLDHFIFELLNENFDRVVNLSFSPFSSYLTSLFEMNGSRVSGYSRHSDGYLSLPDDGSAYFYAQAGVGRPSRIPMIELFSMVSEVTLEKRHRHPEISDLRSSHLSDLPKEYVVVHVGASDLGKSMDSYQLKTLVQKFLTTRTEDLVFIGVATERHLAQGAKPLIGSERIYDLTGKTEISKVFSILKNSKGFIGCDSSPLQMASLLNVPTLNLTCNRVNSYETGPFSEHFQILDIDECFSERSNSLAMAFQAMGAQDEIRSAPLTDSTLSENLWALQKALYMGDPYPQKILPMSAHYLSELIADLPKIFQASSSPEVFENQQMIGDFDQRLIELEKMDPFMGILIRWFNTERIRIAPASLADVKAQTLSCIENFYLILSDWARVLGEKVQFISEIEDSAQFIDDVVNDFRFANVSQGFNQLEKILPLIATAASTEVRVQLENSIQSGDFSRIADILEYKVRPLLLAEDMLA